ncbi:hypothetical protein BDA96_10G089800 [Sorghum bicolor]|uniref:Uncharacterized protein n=1 Tax=Sorghum bicolor TaxID=4558 RepID=A0A921Q2P6_SORBI|nr:hypothetical protein BDA96_10G089800 [Sorghum bicolor]
MCRGSELAQATNRPRSPISSAVTTPSACHHSPVSSPAPPISSFPSPLSFVLPSLLLPLPPQTTLAPSDRAQLGDNYYSTGGAAARTTRRHRGPAASASSPAC